MEVQQNSANTVWVFVPVNGAEDRCWFLHTAGSDPICLSLLDVRFSGCLVL